MKIGWFESSGAAYHRCATGDEIVALPAMPTGLQDVPPIQASAEHAGRCTRTLDARPVNCLLDENGRGLHFVATGKTETGVNARPLHDYLGVPLVSHFIKPVWESLGQLPAVLFYSSMASPSWVKLVSDQAHAHELTQFGIPSVFHMPPAAPDRDFDTRPLANSSGRAPIGFVGDHLTSPINPGPASLFALGCRSSEPAMIFHDIYHHLLGLAEPTRPDDSGEARLTKMAAYFNVKAAYSSMLNVMERDRFVVFLKKQLGNLFEVRGSGWDSAYAVPCVPGTDDEARTRSIRETLINVILIDGRSETGLGQACFDVTAAGGFLLCQQQAELGRYFEIGRECDTFSNERELLEKCRFYLEHPAKARDIALAGQKRTLGEHLHSHRLGAITRLVESLGLRESRVPELPRCYSLNNPLDDFDRLVPRPDVIIDGGAHIGAYSYSFRRRYPEARIISFEPVSANFERLATVASEIGVVAVRAAMSDRNGTDEFILTASDQSGSLLPYQANDNPLAEPHAVIGREQVPVCMLDTWCSGNAIDPRRVSFIKLDVQGAELKALAGATVILRSVPAVLLEVGFKSYYEGMPLFADVDRFMQQRGFVRYALYPSGAQEIWGDALYVRRELADAEGAKV